MTKMAKISIILNLLTVTFGMATCNIGCAPPDPLTDTVIKADLIFLGTITDNRTDVVTVMSGNSIRRGAYTFFTLSVEKVLKGDPSIKEAIIRLPGGPIGDVYQVPTEGYFAISDMLLVLLHREEDNVYTIPYLGLVWAERPTIGAKSVVGLPDSIGRIIKIMKANDIPIALPPSEWPPLPAPVPVSPPKNRI